MIRFSISLSTPRLAVTFALRSAEMSAVVEEFLEHRRLASGEELGEPSRDARQLWIASTLLERVHRERQQRLSTLDRRRHVLVFAAVLESIGEHDHQGRIAQRPREQTGVVGPQIVLVTCGPEAVDEGPHLTGRRVLEVGEDVLDPRTIVLGGLGFVGLLASFGTLSCLLGRGFESGDLGVRFGELRIDRVEGELSAARAEEFGEDVDRSLLVLRSRERLEELPDLRWLRWIGWLRRLHHLVEHLAHHRRRLARLLAQEQPRSETFGQGLGLGFRRLGELFDRDLLESLVDALAHEQIPDAAVDFGQVGRTLQDPAQRVPRVLLDEELRHRRLLRRATDLDLVRVLGELARLAPPRRPRAALDADLHHRGLDRRRRRASVVPGEYGAQCRERVGLDLFLEGLRILERTRTKIRFG